MKKMLFSLTLMLMISTANAGVVSIEKEDKPFNLNDNISIKVIGTDFDLPLDGFGLNIEFDESVLELISVFVDPTIWEFHKTDGERSTGKVEKIGGASFRGVENEMQFVTLEFKAIGAGISSLILADADHRTVVWSDISLTDIPLDFVNSQVQVVPVPAAIWFMFTALGSVVAFGRSKKRV